MSVSQKYRTFDQLLEDVTVDFRTYALEGMIEPQQLIKVAIRVNYDLGLRIQRTKHAVIEVENNKADFNVLNFAAVCGTYLINATVPSGTHIDTTQPKYVPSPTDTGPCEDPGCTDVCVVRSCPDKPFMVIQRVGASSFREYQYTMPLRIKGGVGVDCECPNVRMQSTDIAEIKDGFLLTNFSSGKVYMSYQGTMEDEGGNLIVLDHPYCNEYYEYAIKERILENMIFAGEQVINQLQFVQGKLKQRLKASRNNALSFVNTPDFAEYKKIWTMNRRAQYDNYYNMFKSTPTNG